MSVKGFCDDPLVVWDLPNYHNLMGSKTIDYAGEEVSHSLPLPLEELLLDYLSNPWEAASTPWKWQTRRSSVVAGGSSKNLEAERLVAASCSYS